MPFSWQLLKTDNILGTTVSMTSLRNLVYVISRLHVIDFTLMNSKIRETWFFSSLSRNPASKADFLRNFIAEGGTWCQNRYWWSRGDRSQRRASNVTAVLTIPLKGLIQTDLTVWTRPFYSSEWGQSITQSGCQCKSLWQHRVFEPWLTFSAEQQHLAKLLFYSVALITFQS